MRTRHRLQRPLGILVFHIAALAALLLVGAGCGSKAPGLTPAQAKAFDGASSEVKQAWQQALAAAKSNNYSNAVSQFEGLKQMQLTEDQRQAVEMEYAIFGQRLWTAAEKNDPAAVEMVKSMRQTQGRNRTATTK